MMPTKLPAGRPPSDAAVVASEPPAVASPPVFELLASLKAPPCSAPASEGSMDAGSQTGSEGVSVGQRPEDIARVTVLPSFKQTPGVNCTVFPWRVHPS